MKKSLTLLLLVFGAMLAAGIYGALHDQLTYTISEEYYTNLKFIQFGVTDQSLSSPRWAAAIVGFRATWWFGFWIGLFVGLSCLVYPDWQTMLRKGYKSFILVLITALLIGLAGLALGFICDPYIPAGWQDEESAKVVRNYVAVGYMHNGSYLGGAIGILITVARNILLSWRNKKAVAKDAIETSNELVQPRTDAEHNSNKQKIHIRVIPLPLIILSFTISGIISTYSYVLFAHGAGPLLPGFFYTISTLILFVTLDIQLQRKPMLYYAGFMMLLWIATYLVTAISSYFAMFAGIATSGLSSMASLMILHKFIKPVRFNRMNIFCIGSLAFVITDLLMLIFSYSDKMLIEHLVNTEDLIPALFAESIFFWQVITGTILYKTLRSSSDQ